MSKLEELRDTNPYMAAELEQLVARTRGTATPGYLKAEVAVLAVRGLVRVTYPGGQVTDEWLVVTEELGMPSEADWRLAQRTYGPTAGLPGLPAPEADCSRRDGPDCVGHSPWTHNDQLWAEAVEAVEAEEPVLTQELVEEHNAFHLEESEAWCPLCRDTHDPEEPVDEAGSSPFPEHPVPTLEAVEAELAPAHVMAYDPVAHIALVRETSTWSVWAVVGDAHRDSGMWVGNATRYDTEAEATKLYVELSYTHGEEGSRSEAIVRASEAQLHRPLEERELNPHTGWLPLTVDEVIALVAQGQADGPDGSVMAWQAISDCDDPGDPDTGECICWAGVNQEPADVAEAESDPMGFGELRSWHECEAPFELWS